MFWVAVYSRPSCLVGEGDDAARDDRDVAAERRRVQNRLVCQRRLGPHLIVSKPFRESQFPHTSVNLFFILVIVREKLTDLWGS